jgi:uncharacterized phage protein (TIGR01671 family)
MENRFLFRGKRIDNGEWIVGSLIVDKHQHIETGEQIEIIGIYPSEYKDFSKRIDPSTICQCTGLKDKNGKLIFENDILSGHIDVEFPEDETRKRVVWHKNGWCTNEPGCDDYEELDDFDSENFEVIGNMIDNPELLEVQE